MGVVWRKMAPWLLFLFVLASSESLGQDVRQEDQGNTAPAWVGSISIGPSSWSSLQDFNSNSGDGFDSIGWSLDLGAHRHVTRWGSADVLLGADLGFFGTEGDIPGAVEDYTQRGLYLTPSARFRFGERADRHMDLEIGVGWYEVDIVELVCSSGSICSEFDEPFNSDTIGGYFGISGGFGNWFVLGLRVHMADFGTVSGIGSDAGKLNGPIFTLNFGASLGGL